MLLSTFMWHGIGMGKQISKNLDDNIKYMNQELHADKNFDIIFRALNIGNRKAAIYCIDGFTKDEILEKLIEFMFKEMPDKFPDDAHEFSKTLLPYTEIGLESDFEYIILQLLSGLSCLFIDGYNKCVMVDCRTYPSRSVQEPDKDKVQRGSRDGFVETIVFNAALIRRRIRDPQLTMEVVQAGQRSMTDIALCYIADRVNQKLIDEIRDKIKNLKVDALTMNQQSLVECLYPYKWFNPFPKFRFSERPDTAAASILEGNIVILVDNSPSAIILPSSLFDIMEEADDYYFPPVTGTYLRFSRLIITVMTFIVTPLWLLLIQNPDWLPEWLLFIRVKETINVPIILQLLLLELAIDGLRLAAVNTPSMLTTPLSVMAALVLGEFSVKSGWFNSEPMLYMAFVSIANYSQSSFELGYAIKFMRIITLVLTALFNIVGFIAGMIFTILALSLNKTVSGQSYLYPLIPFSWKNLKKRIFRSRIPHTEEPRS